MRTRVLGPGAPPLPVVGPRPLRRVLAAVAALEPMAFRYVDTLNTVPGEAPAAQVRCTPAPSRHGLPQGARQLTSSACMRAFPRRSTVRAV